MLLDFTVENFRSIKGAETLSAVAASKSKSKSRNSESNRRVKSDDEIAQPFHVEGWDIDVLPVIAIFGANASGKSNILKALDYLLAFMSAGKTLFPNHKEFSPFKLNKASITSPTRFEIRTVFDGNIYTYSLALCNSLIVSERLEYALASTKRQRLLFDRNWNQELQTFEWRNGSDFSGSHIQLEKELNEQEPFISLLSRVKVPVTRPLIQWLQLRLVGIDFSGIDFKHSASKVMHEHHKVLEEVEGLLCKLDTGLDGIRIKKAESEDNYQVYAVHYVEGKEVLWLFEEESMGTQRLLSLVFLMNIVFSSGCNIILDELGSNIHPNINRKIVRLFQNPKTNPKRAQLIFSSHDNTLQRNNLLRRDQIWFTQKRPDQSTKLYPLSDFKVRNDLAIDIAYLDGRFRAVPFIPDDDDLISPKDNNNG
jgi:AAA15 family ATPase/GTPase